MRLTSTSIRRFGAAIGAAALAVTLIATTASAAPPPDKKIARSWKANCASCHGADGKGQTEKGQQMAVADMTSPDWQKKTDDDMRKAINEGVKETRDGKKKEMDPFKEKLTPEQVDGLIAFVRAFGS